MSKEEILKKHLPNSEFDSVFEKPQILAAMQAYSDQENKLLMRMLEDLTPNGSEFVGDAQACFNYVKDTMRGFAKTLLPYKEENEVLRSNAQELASKLLHANCEIEAKKKEIERLTLQGKVLLSDKQVQQLGLDIMNKQHEVIDGALRQRVVRIEDIQYCFDKAGIDIVIETPF